MQRSELLWQLCAESDSGLLQEMSAGGPGLQQVLLQRCKWRLVGAGLARQTVEAMAQFVRQGKPLGRRSRGVRGLVSELEVLELFEVQN